MLSISSSAVAVKKSNLPSILMFTHAMGEIRLIISKASLLLQVLIMDIKKVE